MLPGSKICKKIKREDRTGTSSYSGEHCRLLTTFQEGLKVSTALSVSILLNMQHLHAEIRIKEMMLLIDSI
jgi:hypothetical protein